MEGRNSGFTLVELMVTVAVVAILASIAAPSFSEMIKNNRLAAVANDLTADLMFARSEATKRGVSVTLCASSTGTECSGTDWSAGRIAFLDKDADGVVDLGEEILRITSALANNIALQSANDSNVAVGFVRYRSRGMTGHTGTVTFKLCDDRTGSYGRDLEINATGRSSLTANTSCT